MEGVGWRGMPNERGGTVKVLPPSRAIIAKIPRCWMKLSPESCFFTANSSISKLPVSFFPSSGFRGNSSDVGISFLSTFVTNSVGKLDSSYWYR